MGENTSTSVAGPRWLQLTISATGAGIGILLLSWFLYGALEAGGWQFVAAYSLCGFYLLVATAGVIAYFFNTDELVAEVDEQLDSGHGGGAVFVGLPTFAVSSFALFLHGSAKLNPAMMIGVEDPSFLDLLLFGVDRVLGVVTFDFQSFFNLSLTRLKLGPSVWASTLGFIFQMVLSLALVRVVVTAFNRAARRPS